MPWDLALAISHANTVLDWYGNLPEDEMPPEWAWPFASEVADHFDMVTAERERKQAEMRNK